MDIAWTSLCVHAPIIWIISLLLYPIGKWELAQSCSAAGKFTAAAGRAAVNSGAPERAERMEEGRRAQETRGEFERSAAWTRQRTQQGACG